MLVPILQDDIDQGEFDHAVDAQITEIREHLEIARKSLYATRDKIYPFDEVDQCLDKLDELLTSFPERI